MQTGVGVFLFWRSWIKFVLVLACMLGLLVGVSNHKFRTTYSQHVQQRLTVITKSTAETFQTVVDLGMPLSMMPNGEALVARPMELDPDLGDFYVIDRKGDVVFSTQRSNADDWAKQIKQLNNTQNNQWVWEDSNRMIVGISFRDGLGIGAGGILVEHLKSGIKLVNDQMFWKLTKGAILAWSVISTLALVLMYRCMPRRFRKIFDDGAPLDGHYVTPEKEEKKAQLPEHVRKIFIRRVLPQAVGLNLIATVIIGIWIYDSFGAAMRPELQRRSDLVAHVASSDIQRTVEAGVPLDSVVGLDDYFASLLSHFPEIHYFGVASGQILFQAGEWQKSGITGLGGRRDVPVYPISHNDENIGYLIINPNPGYVAQLFKSHAISMALLVGIFLIITVLLMRWGWSSRLELMPKKRATKMSPSNA